MSHRVAFNDPLSQRHDRVHKFQVVGASGTVLGFVGLTVADLVVNFGELRTALLRLVITAAAIIFFIVTAVSKARRSLLTSTRGTLL